MRLKAFAKYLTQASFVCTANYGLIYFTALSHPFLIMFIIKKYYYKMSCTHENVYRRMKTFIHFCILYIV